LAHAKQIGGLLNLRLMAYSLTVPNLQAIFSHLLKSYYLMQEILNKSRTKQWQ